MSFTGLPSSSKDVLELTSTDVPEVFRNLIANRGLTPLIQEIHREMGSLDPDLRRRATHALEKLGFTD